jgi:hypothetical protein
MEPDEAPADRGSGSTGTAGGVVNEPDAEPESIPVLEPKSVVEAPTAPVDEPPISAAPGLGFF